MCTGPVLQPFHTRLNFAHTLLTLCSCFACLLQRVSDNAGISSAGSHHKWSSDIRLLALDMDGTLLDSNSKVLPSSVKAIQVKLLSWHEPLQTLSQSCELDVVRTPAVVQQDIS